MALDHAADSIRVDTAVLGLHADRLAGEVLLSEGPAAEAAQRCPRNLHSALTIALATSAATIRVRVIADPAVTLNTHEAEVESALGTASMRSANRPAPGNPKTSATTAAGLSRRLFDPVGS